MPTDITEPIINQSSQDISEIEEVSFQDLKKSASSFIIAVRNQYTKLVRNETITNVISSQKVIKTPLQFFYAYMREYDILADVIKKYQFQFEQKLNSFLGRQMIMTIVNPADGEVYFLNRIGTKILYERSNKNFGRLNVSLSQKFIDQLNNDRNKGLNQGLHQAMEEGIRRWRPAFLKIIQQMEKNNDNWIYYKYNKARKYLSNRYSRGNIAEGYMRAVINDSTDIDNQGLQILHLFENHIRKDSTPGALEGDVVQKINGQIVLNSQGLQQHFAIKEGSFSTAKVGQFLAIAQYIRESKSLTKEELKNSLSDIIKKGFNIEKFFKTATKIATQKVNEAIAAAGVIVTSTQS